MNILVCVDDNYILILQDMLLSLSFYNKNLNIYLIYSNIKKENLEKLDNYIKTNKIGKLISIKFNLDINFPIKIDYISKETYYRLYAPYILPNDIDRILYLDSDIICRGNILDFYNTDFDNNIIVGIENFDASNYKYNIRLELEKDNKYINAGVLLINVNKYKKQFKVEDFNNFISKNSNILDYQDQDVINTMFYKKIKTTNNNYNFQITNIIGYEYNPILVHYTHKIKPWNENYNYPNKAKYYYEFLEKKNVNLLNNLIIKQKENYDKNTIILSIIVPVFNVDKYLKKCLDTITNQLIDNIEIICINDGSSDKSKEILEDYQKKNYKIKIINQENRGLSAARNRGLEIAKGKYIGFVDSDDYISLKMYKELIIFLENNNLDVACCNFYHIIDGKKYINNLDKNEELIINNNVDIIKEYLKDDKIKNYVWQKVYKREIFNNIKFPLGKNYEDIAISTKVCEKINKIGYISKPLYYYLHREGSISKSKDFKKIKDSINNSYERYKYIKEKYKLLNKDNIISMLNRIKIEYTENKITEKNTFIKEFNNIINEIIEDYNNSNINDYEIDKFINEIK